MVQNLFPIAISQQKAVTQDKEFNSGLPLARGKEILRKRSTGQFLTEANHCMAQTGQPLETVLQILELQTKQAQCIVTTFILRILL